MGVCYLHSRSLFAPYSSQLNENTSDTKEPLYANLQQYPQAIVSVSIVTLYQSLKE